MRRHLAVGARPPQRPAHTTKPVKSVEVISTYIPVPGASHRDLGKDLQRDARALTVPAAADCECKFILVLGILLLSGCGGGTPDYFPLDEPVRRYYDVSLSTMDGLERRKLVVDTIPAELTESGQPLHKWIDGRRTFFAKDADGIRAVSHTLADGTHQPSPGDGDLVMPTEPSVGSQWTGRTSTRVLRNTGPPWETLFRVTETVPMSYTIEAVDDNVEVPAGRFSDCVRVAGHGQTNADVGNYIGHAQISVTTTAWYAPNVGMVRSIREEKTDAEALDFGRIEFVLEELHD